MEQKENSVGNGSIVSGIVMFVSLVFMLFIFGICCLWAGLHDKEEGTMAVVVAANSLLFVWAFLLKTPRPMLFVGRAPAIWSVTAVVYLAALGYASLHSVISFSGGLRSDRNGRTWSAMRLLQSPSGPVERVIVSGIGVKRCIKCAEKVTVREKVAVLVVEIVRPDRRTIKYGLTTPMQITANDAKLVWLYTAEADPQTVLDNEAATLLRACMPSDETLETIGSIKFPLEGFTVPCGGEDGLAHVDVGPLLTARYISESANTAGVKCGAVPFGFEI